VAVEPIGRDAVVVSQIGRVNESALLPGRDAVFAHQAFDALPADTDATSS
jgi:hypothetical protein